MFNYMTFLDIGDSSFKIETGNTYRTSRKDVTRNLIFQSDSNATQPTLSIKSRQKMLKDTGIQECLYYLTKECNLKRLRDPFIFFQSTFL